jgi:glycosyltransferase involved in cell wall biosynthesis
MPKVSIGMPIYNGERFLRQALDAILSQTFTDFELTISDNGSSDGTADICRAYMATDSRVRFSRNDTNLGASKNFRKVFELSTGQYFRWAAADDVFAPDSLKECVAVLDAHPEVVLCYPQTVLMDECGKVIKRYEDNLDLRFPCVIERFRKTLYGIGLVNTNFGLMRSEVLRKTPLIRNYPGSDIVLVQELSLHGQFWEIDKPLFYRRLHACASSSIKTVEGLQEFMDPAIKLKLGLPLWRQTFYQLHAIRRAPVSPTVKISLTWLSVRDALKSWDDFLKELAEACRHRLRPNSAAR